MNKYRVSHCGVREPEWIDAESEEAAIEAFREKHGKIRTNHKYDVVLVTPSVPVHGKAKPKVVAEAKAEQPKPQAEKPPEPEPPKQPADDPGDTSPTLDDLDITERTAQVLASKGLTTAAKIVAFGDLTTIKGIGRERAETIYRACDKALGKPDVPEAEVEVETETEVDPDDI